jgi:TRAP-type C4-dicarboxylate transport system permease small subunit
MKLLLDAWHQALRVALTLLTAALVVPVTMQVLSRYTGLIPRYIWTEEIARFCFVWVIMLGAMIGVREGTHFELDALPHSRNPRVEAAMRLLVRLCVLIVALIFLYYGWQFVRFGWNQTSEIAELPMPWIFAAWPLAGLTWVAFLAEQSAPDVRILLAPGEGRRP